MMTRTSAVLSLVIVGLAPGGCSCDARIHGTPDDTTSETDAVDDVDAGGDVQDVPVDEATDVDDVDAPASDEVPIAVRAGQQSVPKVAALPDGGAWISWFSWEDGNYNVRIQRIDAQGSPQLGADGVLVSDNASESFTMDQHLVALPGGDAVVAFQDVRSGDFEAYAYRISTDGAHRWGDDGVRVLGDAMGDIVQDMVVDDSGSVVVAVERMTDAGAHVKLQRIAPTGDRQWSTGIDIVAPGTDSCVRPVLAPTGSGTVIAAWLRTPDLVDTHRTLMARKLDASGAPVWGADAVVGEGDEIPYYVDPVIEPDGEGGAFVAWTIAEGFSILHVRLDHVGAAGVTTMVGGPILTSVSTSTSQSAPALAWLGMFGQVMVFWRETDFGETEAGIHAQRFSTTGEAAWPATGLVAVAVSSTDLPRTGVARSAGGGAVVFYEHQASGSFTSDYSEGLLEAVDAPSFTPREITAVPSPKLWPDVSSEPSDGWWMVWGDQRTDDGDIYAAHIDAY